MLRAVAEHGVIPAAYTVWLIPGELILLAEQWSGGQLFVATSIELLPLILLELAGSFAQRQASSQHGSLSPWPPFRLTLVGFLVLVMLVFSLALDLLELNRALQVFTASTALGQVLTLLVIVGLLCAVLPFAFRVLIAASTQVPEDVRQTARALAFPERDVLLIRTGNRLINAMLVGPLPRMRYLFLTDGLVSLLDPISLRGVVAHEVGHARASHPLLLLTVFGLIPILLFYPLDVIGLAELDATWAVVLLGVLAIAAILLLRRVAHWFELEADLLSADALGGSGPCILALHKVGELSGASRSKSSLRHPSEETRIHHLLSCEGDPWYRERFEKRSRWLRRLIVAAAGVALLLSIWAHTRLWPVDRLIVEFYTGRFPAAHATLTELRADPPPGRGELIDAMQENLTVARSFFPDGGPWSDIRDRLADQSLSRGYDELVKNGAAAARPWFAVGMLKKRPAPLEISLYLYCQAHADADADHAETLRRHLLTEFELDRGVRAALQE